MASRRKKLAKKRDFQKQRIKLGKTNPKSSNHTDTSFTAKAVHVPLQSVLKSKTDQSEMVRNISLTKHNASAIRKEAVSFLEKHLEEYPTMIKQIVGAISKLIIDWDNSVRQSAESLLKRLSSVNLQLNYNILILYVQSAMTHINSSVRNDSTKFLQVLVSDEGCCDLIVNNHWVKLLTSFCSLLHWPITDGKSVVNKEMNKSEKSATIRHLQVLKDIINHGCAVKQDPEIEVVAMSDVGKYLQPKVPSPFAHLELFMRKIDEEKETRCEDPVSRRKVFDEVFATSMLREARSVVKDGGEVGRMGSNLVTMLEVI